MSLVFNGPIPGQSLTTEPKAMPFERPPEIVDPIEALDVHIDNLSNAEAMEDALFFLEMGLDLVSLVEGILRSAVMEGIHSVDVSLIIGPVIHEYIVGIAEVADIKFNEGLDEEQVDDEELAYDIREKEARKILSQLKKNKEPDLDVLEESLPKQPTVTQEDTSEEKPQGLMARPQGVN